MGKKKNTQFQVKGLLCLVHGSVKYVVLNICFVTLRQLIYKVTETKPMGVQKQSVFNLKAVKFKK